ncbi:MAG: glycosyltransferase [Candidatus Competibacteraceae bacterium]|nr:glycosyltransferase [Candidatus Competibacteraceae bacterium]
MEYQSSDLKIDSLVDIKNKKDRTTNEGVNDKVICINMPDDESHLIYQKWLANHSWKPTDHRRLLNGREFYDELLKVHFLLVLDDSTEKLLAGTLEDLKNQVLVNWRLTIFSEFAYPDSQFASSENLEWIQISSLHQANGIASVVENSSAEWFICSPAGLRLSPAFTLIAGLRLRDRPNALLFYTDEDTVNIDREHSQPKLKPDINLELLRSSPSYIGAATLIRKSLMLDPRIAILPPGLSRNYGAALLAAEQGPNAIDHLDEILVHVPESLADEYAATPLAHLLVQQHLARCGVAAEVRDGPLPGALFIDYLLPDQPPKVSIIIAPTPGGLSNTRGCLESLLTNTSYPGFEILVIDQGIDSGLPMFLAEAVSRFPQIQTLSCPQKQSWLASYNAAARQAQGAFLLFLNDDCIVLQENWLTRLAAIGVRAEVGVVGCRLVSLEQRIKHAGLILGHGGTVDHIGKDLPLAEPGYMGRAQLTQNFSAVSGDCMLVRKELFFEVGGFDEKDFPNLYHDADFCLKVGERGYQIVWTPFVTLAQQNKDGLEEKQKAQKEQQDSRSRKAFIKKWRSRLGNDPAYNRHLSLRQREWMIDGDFDVPWHPDLEPLPRIVAQAPDEMGVGQYRMIGPLKELTDSGRICSFLLPALSSEKRFLPYVSELIRAKPTVFFLQNAFSDFHLDDLQHYADLLPDLFRVFGQDDIVFSIPQKSAARKHFGKDTKARVRKAVSLCHRAIVTTEPIAEAMRGMVEDIRVMPNSLERSRWGDLQPPRNERRKLRVGWAGAQQHQGDLEFILPVVEATANEVDWIFMGMCPPKLRYHVAEAHNAVHFAEYPAALAALDLDLAIAPLELNRFNTAKSNLRLLEYGAVGYPVIATDILPYQNAPVTRVPNNPKAWIDAIRAHVHDPDATRAAGEQLREWVLSHWMLDQHLDEWLKALLPD